MKTILTFEQFQDKAHKLKDTARFADLYALHQQYQGEQFEERELDVCGFRRDSPGVPGSARHSPSFDRRHPGAVWNLRAEVVETITDWTLSGESWCLLKVPGDEAAEASVLAISEAANLADTMEEARNICGAEGAVAVSYAFVDGRIQLETHHPFQTWVLAWENERLHIPAEVVEVYAEEDPMAGRGDEESLVMRRWTTTDEAIYRRVKSRQDGSWVWVIEEVVAHGLGRCPVVWYAQGKAAPGQHDGVPDGNGTEGLIADANLLFGAGSSTTKRNADDTLVVKEDPSLNPGNVKKGAWNTIFARGGAEYLSQNGDSARTCVELAEKRAAQVHRASRVVVPTLEDLGRATTGEAIKRLFQPLIKVAGKNRTGIARGLIVPLCRALLEAARTLSASFTVELFAPDGTPITSFGASSNVVCVWPNPVPPTSQDVATLVTALTTAVTGKIMSRKVAVTMLAALGTVPVANVDDELATIDEESKAAVDLVAAAMAAGGPAPGEAGDVGDEKPKAAE